VQSLFICDETRFEDAAALCRHRQTGIEIQTFYQPGALDKSAELIERHRRAIAGLAPQSLHGPFGDLCPGSFDPVVRAVARFRYTQAVAVADDLGIDHLVLHHSYVPGTSFRANWIQRLTEFWRDFLQAARPSLRIHLENHLETDPTMIAELLDGVSDPRLDACLDIGHLHCYAKADPVDWIKVLGPRIGYVHLHDNDSSADSHLALGQGTISLPAVLAALEEFSPGAIWAVESGLSVMEQSLDWLNANRLR
jgi:sugar phosphate isomerase/epimerase